MTRRNRTLMLQFMLATAVCVVIGLFERPLIGLIGFGMCAAIFALQSMARRERRSVPDNANALRGLSTSGHDAGSRAAGDGVPGCYNPDNPVLPVYYPTERRD